MTLISDAAGRKSGSGYERLFGDAELGHLMSRVQAAVIRNGTELEKIILGRVTIIDDLDVFLAEELMADGVQVAPKRVVKACEVLDSGGAEPDLLVFRRRMGPQSCHVIELKDGDNFDTKKSKAEYANMHSFIERNARHLRYTMSAHFCCFNQHDLQTIYDGFKRKIEKHECMTGPDFCELLEISYEQIVKSRQQDQPENLRYFVEQLRAIPAVTELLT